MKHETFTSMQEEYQIIKKSVEEFNNQNAETFQKQMDLYGTQETIEKRVRLDPEFKRNIVLPQEFDYLKFSNLIKKYISQIKSEDTNSIYIYIGHQVEEPYACIESGEIVWNLEQSTYIFIPSNKYKQFETENHIIDLGGRRNGGEEGRSAEVRYYEIRAEFFEEMLEKSQEEAVKHILKKYKS